MAPGGDRGLTTADAQRWLRGLQLVHTERLVLTLLFVALATVSLVAPVEVPCTSTDPSVCGPSVPGTWALALAFATPILLLSAPALGCVSALALAVLGARYDPVDVNHGWWSAAGVLSVAVLLHLTLIRVRQRRVAAARLDWLPVRGPVEPVARTLSWIRLWFIGAAVLTGIALTMTYQHRMSAKQDHLRQARPLDAVVLAVDNSNYTVDLQVADLVGPVTLDVYSPGRYRVGQEVPVLADFTGDTPWVRLVAEPEDPSAWLSLAILALLLAGVATIRPTRIWQAHRRMIDADRGLPVSLRSPRSGAAVHPVDGPGPAIAKLRISGERDAAPAGHPGFPVPPGGEGVQSRPAYLIGQLWYSGIVRVISADGLVCADALMGLPRLGLTHAWTASPTLSGFARADGPFAAGGARADAAGGEAVAQLATAAVPSAVGAGVDLARDIDAVVFKKPPIGKRGYDEEEVDAFLDRLSAAFNGTGPPVPSQQVRNAVFRKPPIGKRGYDEGEVDAFLHFVATECERHWPSPASRPQTDP